MDQLEWIDTHCHLNYDYDGKTTSDLVRQAAHAGVKAMVTIGCDDHAHGAVQKISDDHFQVYHTIGYHPHEAASVTLDQLDSIRKKSLHPKCRALGEMGLDYYYDHSPREIQIARFSDQLDLAIELKIPVVIHSRNAEDDLIPLLDRYVSKQNLSESERPFGVLHCFTGTERLAKKCLDWGFLISLSGIITFKNANDLREVIRKIPLRSLILETDSPYLAPVPYRGKKCEPKMLTSTGCFLAQFLGLSPEEVAEITTKNAKRFFLIP
jgi:TatD DNase family protein